MNRNVTIVIIILIIVLLAGYLVWLRDRFASTMSSEENVVEVTPPPSALETVAPTPTLSPTPVPTATSAAKKASPSPTKTASPSARPR